MLSIIIISSYRAHALRNLVKSIKKNNKTFLSSIFVVNDTPFCKKEIRGFYDRIYQKFNIKQNKVLNTDGKGPNYGRNEMINYIKNNFKQYDDFLLLDDDLEIPENETNWINRFYKQYKTLNVDILSCVWNCEKEGSKRMHCSILKENQRKDVTRYNIKTDRLQLCHIPLASFISSFEVFSKIQFSPDIKFYGDFLDLGFQILKKRITCICTPFFKLNHRIFPNRKDENDIVKFDPNEFKKILVELTVNKYKFRSLDFNEEYKPTILKQFGFGKPKHFSDSWFSIERLIHDYINFNYENKINFFNSFCEFNHLYNPNMKIGLPNKTMYISHLPIKKSERFPKFNLNELTNEKRFINNIDKIETILCLSPEVKEFYKNKYPNKKIILSKHPIIPFNKEINFSIEKFKNSDKKLIFSGFFYRDERSFLECKADNLKKMWFIGRDKETLETKFPDLKLNELEKEIDICYFEESPDNLIKRLEDSLFIVHLIDATANNTILDCIQSATPIFINRSSVTEYYLGEKYPLFYNNINELNSLLNNEEIIIKASEYLKTIKLKPFSIQNIFNKIDMFYENKVFYNKYINNKKNTNNIAISNY